MAVKKNPVVRMAAKKSVSPSQFLKTCSFLTISSKTMKMWMSDSQKLILNNENVCDSSR